MEKPVIKASECYDASKSAKSEAAYFCPFTLQSGEFAWMDETKFNLSKFIAFIIVLIFLLLVIGDLEGSGITDYEEESIIQGKIAQAYCKEVSALSQDLYPGRACQEGF